MGDFFKKNFSENLFSLHPVVSFWSGLSVEPKVMKVHSGKWKMKEKKTCLLCMSGCSKEHTKKTSCLEL